MKTKNVGLIISLIKTGLRLFALPTGLLLGQTLLAAVTFNVTPPAVSNTYNGTITLQIGGLTNKTVVVQKYLDLNTNGVIDGGDLLVQQFTLQDGTNFVIGGVTNFNVPGDLNATTGAITATLNFQGGDFVQNIAGNYLYKLSSPGGHFAPLTNQFTVTNFPFPQTLNGNVVSNSTSTTVPNAVVLLFPPPAPGESGPSGSPLAGVVANNAGSYTVQLPPGTYMPVAFEGNYAANMNTAPVLTLAASQTITTNLTLTNATTSISGSVVDANNSSIGLPGVLFPVMSSDGLLAITFTDTNGNFNVPVTAGNWKIKADDTGLIVHGYLGLQNDYITNAGATGVTLAVPEATALIYGSVKDNLGNPLTGLDVYANDNNNLYETDGYTDANGNYVLGVLGLGDSDSWYVQANGNNQLTNYVFSQETINGNINAGQAVLQNFTAILAINQITGTVKDSNNNPIAGVGVSANATINGTNYQSYVDTDTYGNYSINVANGSWDMHVSCDGDDGVQNLGYQCPNDQTITIANNNGLANFTVQTNINVGGTLQVTTVALPNGAVGAAYDQQLTADGGYPGSFYSWSVYSGSLPAGLSLDSGGTIQGMPTASGTNYFTVQVSDNNDNTATQALSLTINRGVLHVMTTSLSSGTTNVPYNSQQLIASGGQPPYSWSLASGMLPPGLSLSTNGVISGTPTVAGTSNFVVQVTDSAMETATQALSLVVYTFSTSVTFAVTPPVVSNFYNGIITLQVGGLAGGETVLVQKFRDVNGNGVIDTGDTEVQQFQLTDGQASVFYNGTTAVTNFNVPGDLTPVDGAITAQLYPALSGGSQLFVAQYAFRLSSPAGHFAPLTNLFNVTNSAYAQSFTGNVVCNGTNVPHALVYLLTLPASSTSPLVAGTLADINGAYRLNAPPGTYLLSAVKGGFVTAAGSGPVLALGANATINTNLSLLPATCSISGSFVDAANTNAGLPLVNVKAATANGLVTVGWTAGNGNFTLPATTNWWVVFGDSQNLDSQGYLGLQSLTLVNATAGSVAGVNIALARGTALVFGTVKDGQNNPLSGVRLSGNQNDGTGPYVGDATTDQNGNYAMAVNDAGVWNAGISGNNPAFPNYLWSASLGDTTFSSGQAAQWNFTALLATNQITGTVKDSNNNPIAGVGVNANATINSVNFSQYVDTDTNGNYSMNVANGNWNISINCNGGSDSLDNILGSGTYQCPSNQAVIINNNNATNNFTVQLCDSISIVTASSPAGEVGIYYDQTLQAFSCNSGAYNWTLFSGSLPSGLTLGSNGEIYGVNYASGTYTFTVQVTDGGSLTTNGQFSISISNAVQIITTSLPNGTNGSAYSQQLQAAAGVPFGGASPYSWSLASGSASLPPNLTLATNGLLSGTLAASGTFDFTVEVADSPGGIYHQPLALTVVASTNSPFTTLYTFSGGDGSSPNGLVQGSDGNFYGTTEYGGAYTNQYSEGLGTVFKMTPPGTLTTLYSFSGIDGAIPAAGLVPGANGYFYGTTEYGGVYEDRWGDTFGTVFKIMTNGTFASLYSFSGDDGANPVAGLVQGADGNFYGTTSYGGVDYYLDDGTVFKISANGSFTSLVSFSGSDGIGPEGGLVQGTDGNFYGTTEYGGTHGLLYDGYGTVFKITTNGTLNTLYSFTGGGDGANPAAGLVQGADGNFYGTAEYGGTNDSGTVFKIMTNGTLSTLYSFTGGGDGANPAAGLVQGTDGNFYGTTEYGGAYKDQSGDTFGTVFKITSGGTLTTVYSFTGGSNGAYPNSALVQGTDGNFYGTTSAGGAHGDGAIFRLSLVSPPRPVFQSVTKAGGTITLTWSALAGQTYQLQFKTNLNQTSWNNLGSAIIATNSTATALDSPGPDPQRFYRVKIGP